MSPNFSGKAIFLSRLLFIVVSLHSPYGLAYQKGDIPVRAGFAHIDPRADSGSVGLGGIELGEIDVESTSVPIINISYFALDHLAFELLLGKPPDFDIVGTTGLLAGVSIGNIEYYPLIVTAQYYPLDSQARWQPFVGAGLNYMVGSTQVNPQLAPLFGADSVEIEVEDSWGLVLSLGLDFMLTHKVTLSAEAYYMDVTGKANGTITIDGQDFDVDLFARTGRAPVLYSVAVGYIF